MLQLVTYRWHIIHHDVSMSDMSKTSMNYSVVCYSEKFMTFMKVAHQKEWYHFIGHIPDSEYMEMLYAPLASFQNSNLYRAFSTRY